MSREWYHWPLGVKEEWEEGTLPSADSVFRADFMNQFVGWWKYLKALGGTLPPFGYKEFSNVSLPRGLVDGWIQRHYTDVQYASFLNCFIFWPGDGWIDSLRDEWVVDETIPSFLGKLNVSGELPGVTPISAGDDIHPREASGNLIRNFMLACRTRMDRCQVIAGSHYGDASAIAYRRYWWTKEGTEEEPVDEYHEKTETGGSGYYVYKHYGPLYPTCGGISLTDVTVPEIADCGCSLVAICTGPYSEGDPWSTGGIPFPTPASGSAECLASIEEMIGDWTALPDETGKLEGPTYEPYEESMVTVLQVLIHPLDTLPEAYKPPA